MARPIKCPDWIKIGEPRPTKRSGEYIVTDYVRSNDVKIRFLDTGYETSVLSTHVKNNSVKDPMTPTNYGVGYLGEIRTSKGNEKPYKIWNSMLQRCYSPKKLKTSPSYIGCSVCDEWLNFTNFLKWYKANYLEGMELDKDSLIEGNKIYSPNTCKFISSFENKSISTSKPFKILDPNGKVISGKNLRKYCRDHNYNYKLSHHKGVLCGNN